MMNTTLGGLASIAGGGKFANGAVTGAFGYLANSAGHSADRSDASTGGQQWQPKSDGYDVAGPQYPPPPDRVPGGPWTWYDDPNNSRGGTYYGQANENGVRPQASWDAEGGHWDVDNGQGNRQRYNWRGAPISAEEAHGEYRGPPRIPLPPRAEPLIWAPPCILIEMCGGSPNKL
jgi:hypothetical protein